MQTREEHNAYMREYYSKPENIERRKTYKRASAEANSSRQKAYRASRKEETAEVQRAYRLKNKDKRAETKEETAAYQKAYRAANRDIHNLRNREYRKAMTPEQKASARAREAQRKATDPQFRLAKLVRRRLRTALKGGAKVGSAVAHLGCTVEAAVAHVAGQFQQGMSWENHGFTTWHIDHIKPLSSFDLTDPEQLAKACHYSNLQPLWAQDNLSKGARIQ